MDNLKQYWPLAIVALLGYAGLKLNKHVAREVDVERARADAAVILAMASLKTDDKAKPDPKPAPATPKTDPKIDTKPSGPITPRPIPRISLAMHETATATPSAKGADQAEAGDYVAPKRYQPWEASVIVRSQKGKETRQGSGTAICEHTVLTCAHIIGDGFGILVDNKPAELVDIDRTTDLALLRTKHELTPARVATVGPRVGDAAMAWGYEWDKQGLLRGFPSKIAWLNRYAGPDNLLVSGKAPLSGRSGGGLFNTAGELIGVCSANDKPDAKKPTEDGLYVGFNPIKKMIDPEYKPAAIDYVKHITPEEAKAAFPNITKNTPARGASSSSLTPPSRAGVPYSPQPQRNLRRR